MSSNRRKFHSRVLQCTRAAAVTAVCYNDGMDGVTDIQNLPEVKHCESCGAPFYAKRRDAKYCPGSVRCRVRGHRARKAEKVREAAEAAEIARIKAEDSRSRLRAALEAVKARQMRKDL